MSTRSTRLPMIVLALLFAAVPMMGCEPKEITFALPGFGSGNIDGLWLWRLGSTGQYERVCKLQLADPQTTPSGTELLPYLQVCDAPDEVGLNMTAKITRLSGDPTTIVVKLWYFRFADAGQFKASSYNSAGESPLSAQTLAF
jgi:hypothetical protein